MSLDTVRVSKRARDQLTTLKRRTGIQNWNIICRWAFCVSIAEKTPPRKDDDLGETPIEMTWHTFAGEYHELYLALLKNRCVEDEIGTDKAALNAQLRRHLHRGIGYLVGDPNMKNISSLVGKAV